MADWQPISSAPKDGTRLLLWCSTRNDADDRLYIEQICDGEHVDAAQIGFWDENEFNGVAGWVTEFIGKPTHWQPLPAPPEAGA